MLNYTNGHRRAISGAGLAQLRCWSSAQSPASILCWHCARC